MSRFLRRLASREPRPEMGDSNMGRFIPRGNEPHGSRGKAVWPLLLTCLLFTADPVLLFAQTQSGDNVRTFYVAARSFTIPFSTPDNDPRIDVLLHYSTDGQNYRNAGIAKPRDGRFSFTATSDGWYFFIVQTRDQGGALTPHDLHTAPPSMKVYVDTQKPVIEVLESVQATPENPLPRIRWVINELNLKEILADYRSTSGGEWYPLLSLPNQTQGEHTWKPHLGGELEVRMVAFDKAGSRSDLRTLRLRVADNVTHMQPPPDAVGSGKVMHVRSKTFLLHYQLDQESVGPSQVASVDIWKVHQGRDWQKCKEQGTPKGPASVTVDETGRWGFRLIPRSGVGLAERDPVRGDAPDIWVEVDDKPPQVKITNITVTQEADGGYLTVYWKADDAYLSAMPITIYRASPQGRDWVEIAKQLSNTGSWRQRTDSLSQEGGYEFLIKVTARDEAGNIGSDQWRDTVKVDLKIPRIKHIEVKPDGTAGLYESPGAGSPSGAPSAAWPPSGSRPPNPAVPSSQQTARPSGSSTNATNGGFSNIRPP